VPIKLQSRQDITVNPADYVVGDVDGVVVIPAALAEKAVSLMRPQVEADARMHKAIREGTTFTEASKQFRL
jgi:regulator of RNase E activity RraA